MGISYKKLWVMLIQKDITKSQLRTDIGLSAGTMSKLNKGEEVALSVLLRICDYLVCDIGDISYTKLFIMMKTFRRYHILNTNYLYRTIIYLKNLYEVNQCRSSTT